MAGCIHERLSLVCTDEDGVPYYRCEGCGTGIVISLMHEITESVLGCHIMAAEPGALNRILAAAVVDEEEPPG